VLLKKYATGMGKVCWSFARERKSEKYTFFKEVVYTVRV
jgi:hypothetical protein